MEIPSGAIADLFGRRRSMILSFASYIIAFAAFGFGVYYWHFFVAMFFFAIGEAFRTGTHKAMIFTWLRNEGRTNEKTKVYGYTRSWTKLGSALSIVLAGLFIWLMQSVVNVSSNRLTSGTFWSSPLKCWMKPQRKRLPAS